MGSKGIYPNANMPPATCYFSIGRTSARINGDLKSSQGVFLFPLFFFWVCVCVYVCVFDSACKQADWFWRFIHFRSFLQQQQQRLCRQYNYSPSVLHSCSEQISLFCFKNKHRQLSDLVPILPSVSASLLEAVVPLHMCFYMPPLRKYSCNSIGESSPEMYLPSFHAEPFYCGILMYGKEEFQISTGL